ncbi:TPA: hypothetical protein N0F65_012742 [Lagenidium giganteum]|uniref:Pitrilysin n=1 Tax=Lagenidium giganteum TaxID=4803 RepID=A0AAV2YA79_9STRA|nr:TPA: hypothetical protein N0F65_012742 [Lagenidium giganteum]
MTEYAYNASLAGMNYDVALQGINTIQLGLVGYSDRLPVLLERIITMMRTLPDHLERETFERVRQATERTYLNTRLDEAFRYGVNQSHFLTHEGGYLNDDRIATIPHCTYERFLDHCRRLYQQLYFEAFVYGNLYEADALALIDGIQKQLQADSLPLLPSQRQWGGRMIQLADQVEYIFPCTHPNPDNRNCVVDGMFQIGRETMAERVRLALVGQIASEPFFDKLRTQEQLGYTVFSMPFRRAGVQMFRFIVQSNVARPEFIQSRVEAFWKELRATIVSLSHEQFQKFVGAVVKEYTEKPQSQEEEVQALVTEIWDQAYVFDRKAQLARLVQTLQVQEIVEFFDTYIAADAPKRKMLSVHVYSESEQLPTLDRDEGVNSMAVATAAIASVALNDSADASTASAHAKQVIIRCPHKFKREMPLFSLPATKVVNLQTSTNFQ